MIETTSGNPKLRFPFGMIERMMPLYPVMAVMGLLLVLLSFLAGWLLLAPANGNFFADAKLVRETAEVGSSFVKANAARHVLATWIPGVKFFGLGLMLMSMTMALGTIALKLRQMGVTITSAIREDLRPSMPPIPKTVRVFQLGTVMGVMVLVIAMIIAIVLAAGPVASFWNHSIANELNQAVTGSSLLALQGTVQSFSRWLNPLRMIGMAFLFTGITLALKAIIGILQAQAMLLTRFSQEAAKV
jgi:hypothetical protein